MEGQAAGDLGVSVAVQSRPGGGHSAFGLTSPLSGDRRDPVGPAEQLVRGLLTLAAIVLTTLSLFRFADGVVFLNYVLFRAEIIDGRAWLSVAEMIFAAMGVVGSWLELRRRAYAWTVLFLVIQLPLPILIEANRCDVESACQSPDWAQLPTPFLQWNMRFPGR